MARHIKLISRKLSNREHAGQLLGDKLAAYAHRQDVMVLGLAPGGVPVAYEVAKKLRAPLDALVVRPVPVPGSDEMTMGAVAGGDLQVVDRQTTDELGLEPEAVDEAVKSAFQEWKRDASRYRGNRPPLQLDGWNVVLVDDGGATPDFMESAARVLRRARVARLIVALPVGGTEACERLARRADEVVCALTPFPFEGVNVCYSHLAELTNEDVRALLDRSSAVAPAAVSSAPFERALD
jgi:predicted phosphoribosyltransferase